MPRSPFTDRAPKLSKSSTKALPSTTTTPLLTRLASELVPPSVSEPPVPTSAAPPVRPPLKAAVPSISAVPPAPRVRASPPNCQLAPAATARLSKLTKAPPSPAEPVPWTVRLSVPSPPSDWPDTVAPSIRVRLSSPASRSIVVDDWEKMTPAFCTVSVPGLPRMAVVRLAIVAPALLTIRLLPVGTEVRLIASPPSKTRPPLMPI